MSANRYHWKQRLQFRGSLTQKMAELLAGTVFACHLAQQPPKFGLGWGSPIFRRLAIMTRFSKLLGAAAVVATISMAATTAQATPFVSGSFGIGVLIDSSENSTNLATDTHLTLDPASTTTVTPESGSFTVITIGEILSTPTELNFGTHTGFDFSQPGDIGVFTASSASSLSSGPGFHTWEVDGTYTPGGLWDPSGTFAATEIWSCTQSGGTGNAITCSGTFNATRPTVPEPLTLSIFGAGLAGAAAIRRRRKLGTVA